MCENSNHSKNLPLFGAIIPYSKTGALQYFLVLSILKFNKGYNMPVKFIFQELLETAQYCGPSSCLHRASVTLYYPTNVPIYNSYIQLKYKNTL